MKRMEKRAGIKPRMQSVSDTDLRKAVMRWAEAEHAWCDKRLTMGIAEEHAKSTIALHRLGNRLLAEKGKKR